ncbi:MAG: C25 family peptidase propeptide domain-containing protein, partial [Planctomycetota bacterium]
MKRLILLTLVGLLLVASAHVAEAASVSIVAKGHTPQPRTGIQHGPAAIVLDCEVRDFTRREVTVDGQPFYHIALEREAPIQKVGAPDLPHVCRSVIIPDDSRMVVSVVDSSYYEIEDIDIAPSKGPILRNVSPAEVPYSFGEEFQTDGFYPGQLATLGDPYILRNHRGIVVTVNPFQYNPVQRILRVYTKMTLEVAAVGPGEVNVLRRRARGRSVGPSFHALYESHFLNYRKARRRDPKKPKDGGGVGLESYSPLDEEGEMLIIAHDPWVDDMDSFRDWKNSLGIETTVVGVDDIDANTPPSADEIKEY